MANLTMLAVCAFATRLLKSSAIRLNHVYLQTSNVSVLGRRSGTVVMILNDQAEQVHKTYYVFPVIGVNIVKW